jgi:hypothetical protein
MKQIIDLNINGHKLTPIKIDRLYKCAKCNCRAYFYKDGGYSIDYHLLTCNEYLIKKLLE